MSTPGVNVPLEKFPREIAEELKSYAEKYSFGKAKLRCRCSKREEADNDKSEAGKHFASFKEKCEGLLSDNCCQDIKSMLENSSWYAANKRKSKKCWKQSSRKGYESDASYAKREVEESY